MRIIGRVVILSFSLLGSTLVGQSVPPAVKFPGAVMKWIHAAEPEFQRRNLDVNKYTITIVERRNSVFISLSSPDAIPGARGSTGRYPGFEIEISKEDLGIVRSNYIR